MAQPEHGIRIAEALATRPSWSSTFDWGVGVPALLNPAWQKLRFSEPPLVAQALWHPGKVMPVGCHAFAGPWVGGRTFPSHRESMFSPPGRHAFAVGSEGCLSPQGSRE